MNKIILLALGVSVCLSAYVPSGYTSVPLATGNANATIQTALNFGESAIVTALVKGNYISNTNFNVSQVLSYAQQVQGTATNFAFSAVFSNYNDTTISSNYTVSRSKTGTLTLLSYSVTISKTTPVASNFVDVSPSEVASSQIIQALLKAGFNLVVSQVQQSNPYITGPFTVNVTNSVQRQVLANGTVLYKFNVQGYNNNSVEIAAAYALSYTASTGKTILLASTYVIVDGDTVDDLGELESGSGYTQISQGTVNSNALIQKIRDFGIKAIVADGVQKGKIPNNTYVISATNGVYMDQLSSTVTDYKFNLVLTDNKGTTINAIYIVSYDSQTQAEEMVGFVYTSQRSG